MDKKEDLLKVKPATRGGKAAGPSKSNGSSPAAPSTSSSGPETIIKKVSSGNLSPLTQRTPGRLPSLTPKRNLSLVTEKASASVSGVKNSVSGAAETLPKPKKVVVPNLASGRRKPQTPIPVIKQEVPDAASTRGRGRGRGGRGNGGSTRGRGRGKPELIQTGGGLFSDGVTELTRRDRNFGQRESSASSSGMERPKLNMNVKVNKEEEDAKLANLLNDDFMVDEDEEYDPNTLIQPLTLPKSKMEKLPEVKLEMIKLEAIEAMEVDVGELEKGTSMTGGVKIKQEKLDEDDLNMEVAIPSEVKPDIVPKSKTKESKSMFQRRLNPSDITAPQMIEEEGTILFIQLPDVLPTNKPQTERLMIKNEPGVAVNETPINETVAEEAKSESVFDDVPEGQLGFLLVHQSGKITLQVGEQNFVVDSSAQISYLQDLISVDVNPEDKSGTMTNIGRIKFKGACLPDWEDLIDDS